MGTRHLIAVYLDGGYKVAQYGQWGGYLEGQGHDVLNFLKDVDVEAFKENLRNNVSFATEEELEQIYAEYQETKILHAEYSRDTGSGILDIIMSGRKLKLRNLIEFAGNSLLCEFGYVIDLDKNTFEIYKGFNKSDLSPEDRFYGFPTESDEYKPIELWKSFDLSNLPEALIDDEYGEDE